MCRNTNFSHVSDSKTHQVQSHINNHEKLSLHYVMILTNYLSLDSSVFALLLWERNPRYYHNMHLLFKLFCFPILWHSSYALELIVITINMDKGLRHWTWKKYNNIANYLISSCVKDACLHTSWYETQLCTFQGSKHEMHTVIWERRGARGTWLHDIQHDLITINLKQCNYPLARCYKQLDPYSWELN